MADAKFITFEGGEGAGKSTQIALLAEALAVAGISARTTREPGGTPGAEQIRELLVTGAADRWDAMTEALLHFAARREHLSSVVRPSAEEWITTPPSSAGPSPSQNRERPKSSGSRWASAYAA